MQAGLVLVEPAGSASGQYAYFETAFATDGRRFGHGLPIVSLCLYDVRRFSSLSLLHALRGHPDSFHYPVEQWIS